MLYRYAEYFSNDGKCYWAGQIVSRVELGATSNLNPAWKIPWGMPELFSQAAKKAFGRLQPTLP